MKLKTITPETVTNGGMSITLTHECEVLNLDPRKGAERRVMKGYLNAEGRFIDWGDHVVETLTPAELAEVSDSKPDYKLSDVRAKVETVKAAKEAERVEKDAEQAERTRLAKEVEAERMRLANEVENGG